MIPPDTPVTDRFEEAADAVVAGNIEELTMLLQAHPSLVLQRSARSHGATLLHYTAATGVEDQRLRTHPAAPAIARLLLQHGAEVDSLSNIHGGGPASTTLSLLGASFWPYAAGQTDALIRVLADAGANLNGIHDDGLPLASALYYLYPEAGRTLVDLGARCDDLASIAAFGSPRTLAAYLHATPAPVWPFFPDIVAADGPAIAFSLAGLTGNLPTIRAFAEAGVSVDIPGLHGATALHYACFANHKSVVRYLLKEGADPTQRDLKWSKNARDWALSGSHRTLTDSLAKHAPLSIWEAVAWDALSQVADLLAHEPSQVHAWDDVGYQPIHYLAAPLSYDKQLLRLLLQYGADINSRTQGTGRTLYDLAEAHQSHSFLHHLRRLGARPGEAFPNL